MKYAYPKFSKFDLLLFRILGPGLGNLLFPWARAKVFAKKNNTSFIFPTWPQLKLGPVLRNELDKRFYFGLFKPNKNDVFGIKKAYVLLTKKNVDEKDSKLSKEGNVIVFSGMKGMFSELIGYSDYLRNELLSGLLVNRISDLEKKYKCKESVAVHIRMGDFRVAKIDEIVSGANNVRLPMSWYISLINEIRNMLGKQLQINLFSDALDSELSEILSIPGICRISDNSAIEDMILMSQHKILVASASTFSMWASFLGQVPTIWYKGQLKQRLLSSDAMEIEVECGDEIPNSFFENLK